MLRWEEKNCGCGWHGSKKWPEKNENGFLGILYDTVGRDPNCGGPSFKNSDWQEMDDELFLAVGEEYGSEKLRGKYNCLG